MGIKAIFIDHMGTIVNEESKYAQEVIGRAYQNSDATSIEEIMHFWFETNAILLAKSYGKNFQTVYDLSIKSFSLTEEKFNLRDNITELCSLLEKNWMYAPAFPDTVEFFTQCQLPIYILSNNDNKYIKEAMTSIGINPTGVITSEMAQAYKPRREIFELALKISNCKPNEVIHIGDSIENDVLGARAVGIEPWLLDRTGSCHGTDVKCFTNLIDALYELQK